VLTQGPRIVPVEMESTLRIRITVRGRLGERVAAAFDGITLRTCDGATELVGDVVDQSQLHGLLTRIRDLGLELESMNVLSVDRPTRSRTQLTCTASAAHQRTGAHP
jgi:hypothetical protein